MTKSDIAIKLIDVDKSFNIGALNRDSIKEYFINPTRLFKSNTKKFDALSDVSFEIKKGEFVGVIGKNGSGKSTLLKLIAGIYAPDKGKVKINGKLVPFLELGVGFNQELSGRENIFLNGTILGMTRKYLKNKFNEIVEFAELENFIDTPIKNYSSGMQVRLAFSIAIQAHADIFLLDEVFSVGDIGFQKKSLDKIQNVMNSGEVTGILVSHNMDQIGRICNRVIYMEDGKVKLDGNPQKVLQEYHRSFEEQIKKDKISNIKSELLKAGKTAEEIEGIIENLFVFNDNGDNRATLVDFKVSGGKSDLKKEVGEVVNFNLRYKIHGKIDNPVVLIQIKKTDTGDSIYINTPRQKSTMINSLKGGEEINVNFKYKININPGTYEINARLGDPIGYEGGTGAFASNVEKCSTLEIFNRKDEGKDLMDWSGTFPTDFEYEYKLN